MLFVSRVKNYKVSSKYLKSMGEDVYSVGFPVSEVKKGSLSLANILEKIGAKGFELNSENIVFWFYEIVGYRNRILWIRYPTL